MKLQPAPFCAKLSAWQPKNTSKSTTVEIGTSGLLSRKRIKRSTPKNQRSICANTESATQKNGLSRMTIRRARINGDARNTPPIQSIARNCAPSDETCTLPKTILISGRRSRM